MKSPIIFAGFSRLPNGSYRFRTATCQERVLQLERLGEQASMVRLDQPVQTKSQAAKQLLAQGDRWIPEAQALFVKTARDDNPFKAKKPSGTVRVKSTKTDPVEAYFLAAEADEVRLTPKQAARIRAEFNQRVREAYEAN